MRGLEPFSVKDGGKLPLWASWCAVLCIGMVIMAASLQVCHFHAPGNPGGPEHCPICIALHSALPATVYTVSTIAQATPELVAPPTLCQYQRIWAFRLSCRPPPPFSVDCA